MAATRRAAVAGSWYPADASRLGEQVDQYVARASGPPLPQAPRALIAPHAGLLYSGPVAAHGYRAAAVNRYGRIVLVGPSHFVPFRGVSLWAAGSWDTPFGEVAVDADLAAAVAAASPDVIDMPAAHGREHSLEMQLPFVARLLPGVPIVPLVMGHQSRAAAFALGEAIARAAARPWPPAGNRPAGPGAHEGDEGDPGILLVASSDLSHYEDAAAAAALDAVVIRHVEALDPDGLMSALERNPRHACGGGPMVAVLHAARLLGATAARALHYADSGDVSGDKSSVVGYLSAAVW